MKKKKSISTIYFIIICVIALLFILSPLVLRIPVVYDLVKWFLSAFKDNQYKNTYIGALGSIIGTFLAITGVIWTQKLIEKNSADNESQKNALIMYYDYKFALEGIIEIMKVIYPLAKSNTLPDDEQIISKFRNLKKKRRIYINPNWRQLVTSLQETLSSDEIIDAQLLYYKLNMISISFNAPTSETSRKEDMNSYSIMYSLIDLELPLTDDSISIKNKYLQLQEHLAIIAGLNEKTKEEQNESCNLI